MVFTFEKKMKGNTYVYLGKTIRVGKKVYKMTRFVGKKSEVSKTDIEKELKRFVLDINDKLLSSIVKFIGNKYSSLEYPLTINEIKKIEEMNMKYKEIKGSLDKKDWEDIKKRFVANFVFESNALEGNSLTLKNFSEIVFEDKLVGSADLREVYDAKNSYAVFSKLFEAKKELSEEFIIDLHKKLMKDVDTRFGYKKMPNVLLGRNLKLTEPKDVSIKMKELLEWYAQNNERVYPLELAFKFHHRFEQIHPFADGNGRVGRILLNYILIKKGYYPLIIRRNHRTTYLKVLQAADIKRYIPLIRFALGKAKETYRKFFEVYYEHL